MQSVNRQPAIEHTLRLAVRVLLWAAVLQWAFPAISGLHFRGSALQAVGFAVPFATLGWLGHRLGRPASALPTTVRWITIPPAWIVGFWLLPAAILVGLERVFPGTIGVRSWTTTLWVAALFVLIHAIALIDVRTSRTEATSPPANSDS